MRNRSLFGVIALFVLGCSNQPREPVFGQADEAALRGKAHLTRLSEQSYTACARGYPRIRLLDVSLNPQPLPPGQVSNRIELTRSGAMLWNGGATDLVQLRQYLGIVAEMSPQPLLVVEIEEGAPKGSVQDLRAAIGQSGVCPDPIAS